MRRGRYLQMARVCAPIIRAWWAVTFPLRWAAGRLGRDLYRQSEDESCLGMLQGCVEHEVCGRGTMEESTCFFRWAHDADPVGALRWARDGCVRKLQVDEHSDTV